MKAIIWSYLCVINIYFVPGITTMGPYRVVVDKIDKCKDPEPPYAGNRTMMGLMETHSSGLRFLLKGNFTIYKTNSQYKINIVKYSMKGGKLIKEYNLKNLSCRNTLISQLYKVANVQYNKKTCVWKTGMYKFDGIDLDSLFHIVAPMREYGTQYWQMSAHSRHGTEECTLLKADFVPLSGNK